MYSGVRREIAASVDEHAALVVAAEAVPVDFRGHRRALRDCLEHADRRAPGQVVSALQLQVVRPVGRQRSVDGIALRIEQQILAVEVAVDVRTGAAVLVRGGQTRRSCHRGGSRCTCRGRTSGRRTCVRAGVRPRRTGAWLSAAAGAGGARICSRHAKTRIGDEEHFRTANEHARVLNRPVQPLVRVAEADRHLRAQLVIDTANGLARLDRLDGGVDRVLFVAESRGERRIDGVCRVAIVDDSRSASPDTRRLPGS